MDGKLILLADHVVTYKGREYTLRPGSVLWVKDWLDQDRLGGRHEPMRDPISEQQRSQIMIEAIRHHPPHDPGTCVVCDVCFYDHRIEGDGRVDS